MLCPAALLAGLFIQPRNVRVVNHNPDAPGTRHRNAISTMLLARMYPAIRNILLVYAALLPIVNPFGMAPIFASMTFGYSANIRRTVALRVAVNGFVLLMASLFVGSYVLDFFGVSIGAVELGGGLVVMIAGWRILNQQDDNSDRRVTGQSSSDAVLSKAFYPLTMPLTVGPGSIAVAITLGSNAHADTHLQLIVSALMSTLGIALIGLTIYLCYGFSDELERLLGPTGTSILIRLSAFIVVCIGIQIMFNGVEQFYSEMVRNARAATGAH
jgi:multiple antibiotic resistance protein